MKYLTAIVCVILLVLLLYGYSVMPGILGRPDDTVLKGGLFAHRGLHDRTRGIPENSLAAFREAVKHGFGIEMDIHVSKDGVPFVFHDFTLERMCGVSGDAEEKSLSELKALSLLGTKEKIPSLEEVLQLVQGRVPLLVEIKSERPGVSECGIIQAKLDAYPGAYCIESFNPAVLFWYRRHRPRILRGQLSDGFLYIPKYRKPGKIVFSFLLENLMANCISRPDFISYNHAYKNNFSRRLCRLIQGGRSAAWTVRSEEEMKEISPYFDVFIFESFVPSGAWLNTR